VRAGLALYALLGGLRPSCRFEALPRRRWAELDGLETRDLLAVFRYEDAQTDDARLTRAVLRSAERLGARFICPARFVAARRSADRYEIRYLWEGREQGCTAYALVNAAGPWVDRVAQAISPIPPRPAIELVQGTHVLLAGTLRHGIYYVEAAADRRPVFVMPWGGAILVGTTETPFTAGDPSLVAPQPLEIEYLCETFRRYFPARPVELRASFAGLRVLPAGRTSFQQRPRESWLVTDDPSRAHLVAIYGGKLTTYRATAARVLRLLRRALPARGAARADTATLPLEEDGDSAISSPK
jgi:glycerol-3-phosphate dehydrogenase